MQRNLRIDLPKKIDSEIKSSFYLAKESSSKEEVMVTV